MLQERPRPAVGVIEGVVQQHPAGRVVHPAAGGEHPIDLGVRLQGGDAVGQVVR
jgi:hypothetical protein